MASAADTLVRRGTIVAILTAFVATLWVFPAPTAHAAWPETSTPVLTLDRTIQTEPFVGSSVSMSDNEGSAYVARDGSLWLADDSARRIYEVDAVTGALKRTIDRNAFQAVPQYGGGPLAGVDRSRDIEALAYDSAADALYVFSGNCCSTGVLPAVFRLTRQSGTLQLESYQPLDLSFDFNAAGWNPGDGKLYVGVSRDLRSYDYPSNTPGPTFRIPNLSGIFGITFTADGKDMLVARNPTYVSRVDWATKTLVDGWTFDLSGFGMVDTRAVEVIGDQLWLSDGGDDRPDGDPLSHAVFVFDVEGSTNEPSAPVASFTARPTSGTAPLSVSFTDTSAGEPTGWSWDFGDGQSSTAQNPSHVFEAAGTYTVTLTASNSLGSSTASGQVVVDAAPDPGEDPAPGGNLVGNPGFETDTSGWDTAGSAQVSLARVSGGHSGSWSAKVTNTGTTSVTSILNDAPNWVSTSRAGTYSGSVWVRSDSGGKIYLRIREFDGGTKIGEHFVKANLSSSWQEITGSYDPVAPGSSTIDLAVAVYSAPAGHSFLADDLSLTHPSATTEPVAPTASFTASPTSGTAPLSVDFTDTSAGEPTGWSWDFGDGQSSTAQHPSHVFEGAGTYTVTLTASNDAGSSTASGQVVVDAAPEPVAPTASFTASPTSGTAPLSVDFTDTSAGEPTGWSWDFGDGQSSTAQHPSHVFEGAGTYTVTLTASNDAGSSTASGQVVVDAAPEPSGNLVGNSGFETDLGGWDAGGYPQVSLERVSGGHSGSWSAKVTNTGITSVSSTLNDAPNWVQTSQAGTYTGSVWVRSDSGGKVYLRIREFDGGTKIGEHFVKANLSSSWQEITGSYVPVAPGSSTIDLAVVVYSAPAGHSFFADDVSLTFSAG